jgi:hypothetical protein
MVGTATSPVVGGLFLAGGEAAELRDVMTRFPISQDQRNTASWQVQWEPHSRVWVGAGLRYGSGLPVEFEDDDDDDEDNNGEAEHEAGGDDLDTDADERAVSGIPQTILDKVDFERGRVRPNFNLDLSLGWTLWRSGARSVRLQFDVINATGRLNVVNFTGLFSGTALAPGRMIGIKLRATM